VRRRTVQTAALTSAVPPAAHPPRGPQRGLCCAHRVRESAWRPRVRADLRCGSCGSAP